MVVVLEDFEPLIENFSYDKVTSSGSADVIVQSQPHQIEVGWMKCPCKPIDSVPKRYSNWVKAAWKLEVWNYLEDDLRHTIGYLHQTPIMIETYQVKDNVSVFLGIVFDSNGKLSKSTMWAWNQIFNSYRAKDHLEKWSIATRRIKNPNGKGKIKSYYLSDGTIEYTIQDGLTIENMDIFMDWIGI